METSIFCCPVCGGALTATAHRYACTTGHQFDRAAKGYVNLLLANQKHSAEPGDDTASLHARQRFLAGGYYAPLAQVITEAAMARVSCDRAAPLRVLDCGCGEGWYLRQLTQALTRAAIPFRAAGFDISRTGVKLAAHRADPTEFAVASLFRIPVSSGGIDLALHCFAPFCGSELRRILAPGGTLLRVIPGRRHLFALKAALYDHPYENDECCAEEPGLQRIAQRRVFAPVTLTHDALADLFAMTPYAYRCTPEAAARLLARDALEVETEFLVHTEIAV